MHVKKEIWIMKKKSIIAHRTKKSEDKNTIHSKKLVMCNQKLMQNLRV